MPASASVTASRPSSASSAKLQRWIDLIAALLGRHTRVSFDELVKDVPDYAARWREMEEATDDTEREKVFQTLKRTFERDKAELRALGVPIASQSELDEDGAEVGFYRLDRKRFYLPYLSLVAPDGSKSTPTRVGRDGYRALATLALDHDELSAIVDAAALVRGLGDPLLAAEIDRALRKLAVDLPVGAFTPGSEPAIVLPRARASNAVFEALSQALQRRKLVTFRYHALSTDAVEEREVEPYGLFFVNGHWYLAALDRGRGDLRNFRLNRISEAKANDKRLGSPDYDVPATFRLRDHAASRHAWELGDTDVMRVVVALREETGAALAAARLGDAVDGAPAQRAYKVRRADTFVRWLLSMAGGLLPVSPPEIVDAWDAELDALRRIYSADVPEAVASTAVRAPDIEHDTVPWQPKPAAAQLQRILQLVPEIADGEEHSIDDVAARLGVEASTLRNDLYSLVERYDLPGGFVEGVQVYMDGDLVSANSSHLRRPMRLTVSELCAILLGLSILRSRRTPAEHATIACARTKLEGVVALLPDDAIPAPAHAVTSPAESSIELLSTMREAVGAGRKVRLAYRKSGSTATTSRVVCPYSLREANGSLYLVSFCEFEQGRRIFRFDRMESAELLDDTFERTTEHDDDTIAASGRVFTNDEAGAMIVRYSSRIARWIAEREGVATDERGELVLEHPLADPEWGIRHVLQYGREAEILAPAEMRVAMRERLAGMGASAAG